MKDNGNFNIETSKQCAHDSYITIQTLKNMFETIKNEYQKMFVKMYDFDSMDCYWIGNVFYVADYYFDFYDVKFAVDNAIGFEFLDKWCDYSLTVYENFHERVTLQNYKTGILPYKEEDIENLQKLQKEKNHIEAEIDDLINDMKKTD
jgi:hypothetical protein